MLWQDKTRLLKRIILCGPELYAEVIDSSYSCDETSDSVCDKFRNLLATPSVLSSTLSGVNDTLDNPPYTSDYVADTFDTVADTP